MDRSNVVYSNTLLKNLFLSGDASPITGISLALQSDINAAIGVLKRKK